MIKFEKVVFRNQIAFVVVSSLILNILTEVMIITKLEMKEFFDEQTSGP